MDRTWIANKKKFENIFIDTWERVLYLYLEKNLPSQKHQSVFVFANFRIVLPVFRNIFISLTTIFLLFPFLLLTKIYTSFMSTLTLFVSFFLRKILIPFTSLSLKPVLGFLIIFNQILIHRTKIIKKLTVKTFRGFCFMSFLCTFKN